MNDENQYWINKAGENVGPYRLAEIGEMLNKGDLSRTDPACVVGGEEWSSVGQLLQLDSTTEKSKEGFEDAPKIILAGGSRMSLNSTLTAILFFLILVGAGLYLYVQLGSIEPDLSAGGTKEDDLSEENIINLANEAKDITLFEERKELFVDRKGGAPCNDWVRYYYADGQSLAGLIKFEKGKAIFAHTWMPVGNKSFDTTLQQGSGSVVSYFENGNKREDSKYRGGLLNGVRMKYYENGQKSMEEPMMNGQLHGQVVAWDENGQKIEETFYLSGLKSGPYSIWAKNGQKMEEGSFRNGKPDGKRTQWSNDGTERTEELYENGELVSNLGAGDTIMENGVETQPPEDSVLTGLLELAGEDGAWMETARATHEAVRLVMERFEKSDISGGEIFSDLALGLFQYSKEGNGDSEKVESALASIRNQWGISILLTDGKFLLSELPDSVKLGPVTWEMADYAGDYLGSLRGESRELVVSDIRNLFSSIAIELGTEEQTIRRKVERQIWEEFSLYAEAAKNAKLELNNGVLMFMGTQEKKIKKIDPNGNSIFETMEEEVSYRFNDRIQSKKMGPFLDVLDETRVAFEETRNGNLTIRKYEGLSVFSDLSLPEGERIIYPNITVQFAGVGAISENTLIRAIKVELGEPVKEPFSDDQEENALPF